MFLSGTTTKNVILKVLASPESITTKVYTHTRALPDNLVFSVERKQSNEQVCLCKLQMAGKTQAALANLRCCSLTGCGPDFKPFEVLFGGKSRIA
jgi:hypothetical protein